MQSEKRKFTDPLLSVRMPKELIEYLDQKAQEEMSRKPGFRLTRTDIVRNMIREQMEAEGDEK